MKSPHLNSRLTLINNTSTVSLEFTFIMQQGLYRGFSSYNYESDRSFGLQDIELVKMDLLNHIFTRKGERPNQPNLGTRIPDIVMEPLVRNTIEIIEEDLRMVVDFDPRVQLLTINTTPDFDGHAATFELNLLYTELDMTDVMYLNLIFDNQ